MRRSEPDTTRDRPAGGAKFNYGDQAIQCSCTIRAAFRLPLRTAQGMSRSLFGLMCLGLDVPHDSTRCRRDPRLAVDLSRKPEGPLHLVLDSTGLKVYGVGSVEGR